jgi:hypothetical protein
LGKKSVQRKDLFKKHDFIGYKYGANICGTTFLKQRCRLHFQDFSLTASFYQNSLQHNCEHDTTIGTKHVPSKIFSITTMGDSVISINKYEIPALNHRRPQKEYAYKKKFRYK